MSDTLAHTRTNDWMATYTGKKFSPLVPVVADIDIRDIAHSLSLICRYGGHIDRFYSVAEHCVLMSRVVEPHAALYALLHDATEAYVGDMVRPLKRSMAQYRMVEEGVWKAIVRRFALPSPTVSHQVTDADNAILLNERDTLMPRAPRPWHQDGRYKPLDIVIEGWSPKEAEAKYLTAFQDLYRVPEHLEPWQDAVHPLLADLDVASEATHA